MWGKVNMQGLMALTEQVVHGRTLHAIQQATRKVLLTLISKIE
jgi:hypothetical protein